MPAHGLGDETAGEQADGRARGGDKAEDSEGLGLLVGLGEQRDDHGQDHGGADRAADALHEPGGDQHRLVEGQAAQHGGSDEDGEPDEECAPAAEQVAQPAGQQEQPAEGDQVSVDDPRQARLRELEVALD